MKENITATEFTNYLASLRVQGFSPQVEYMEDRFRVCIARDPENFINVESDDLQESASLLDALLNVLDDPRFNTSRVEMNWKSVLS